MMLKGTVFLSLAVVGTVVAQSVCPGYRASNIVQTTLGLTADLALAGTPCNLYSHDIANLTLTVEYQTGKSFLAVR